jgi:hypothetical protein
VRVTLLVGKVYQFGEGQPGSRLGRGVCPNEFQRNLRAQVRKNPQGGWEKPQQQRPQTIRQARTGPGQVLDPADFGPHLAGQQAVGVPEPPLSEIEGAADVPDRCAGYPPGDSHHSDRRGPHSAGSDSGCS